MLIARSHSHEKYVNAHIGEAEFSSMKNFFGGEGTWHMPLFIFILGINFILFFNAVNCGEPSPPKNGFISNKMLHTRVEAIIEYGCDDGFRPSATFFSTCNADALWIRSPQTLKCTFVKGYLLL